MRRRTLLGITGLVLSTPFIGCLGDVTTLGEKVGAQDGDGLPSECPDPKIESPMNYEEFDYTAPGNPNRDADEVTLLTGPEDVAEYDEKTNVPKDLKDIDFETKCGVLIERALTGNWGTHHLLGLERESVDRVKIYVCSTGKPEPPKNDVMGRLTYGLVVEYSGEVPTEGYLHHYQLEDE